MKHASPFTRWLHLWHERPYGTEDKKKQNELAFELAREAVTPCGIKQLIGEFRICHYFA
jgi:hypothetical protein